MKIVVIFLILYQTLLMNLAKQLVLLFFAALGFHYLIQDVLTWIDPSRLKSNDGYFSAISLTVLYGIIRFFQERDRLVKSKQTEVPN